MRTTMHRYRASIGFALSALLGVAAGIAGASAGSSAAANQREDGPFRLLALPPGEYTSLVFGNGSNQVSQVIELKTPRGIVPMVIPRGDTTTLHFPDGLRVQKADDVMLDATPGRVSYNMDRVRAGLLTAFAIGPAGITQFEETR